MGLAGSPDAGSAQESSNGRINVNLNLSERPRLLDLFAGAGGAARGYQLAGFHVTGVDIDPQPRYVGDEFHQADALTFPLEDFDAIHASPPCQAYSDLQKQNKRPYPDLVWPIRKRLRETGLPYVIENVDGSPLREPAILCGTMFPELRVLRHRLFESSFPISVPPHEKHPLVYTTDKRKAHYGKLNEWTSPVSVNGGGNCSVAAARDAMGIPWMTKAELNEAVPPAYTRHVGEALMFELQWEARYAA